MRYIEYVYLVASVMMLVFVVKEIDNLPTWNLIIFYISMMICAFMFMFRRSQRKKIDQYVEEKMRKLEEDESEEG